VEPAPDHRLHLVEEEARRLARLIDNVLTFSRREQEGPRIKLRACVPLSVVQSMLAQFAPSFARRGLSVSCTGVPDDARLLDADALAQILGNLLSNVEKYVPAGAVQIAGRLDAEELVLTVSDQGPGVPEHAFERVFTPFERLDDARANRGVSGTGLGLAIARDLAVSMGGSLRLVPSARGACFELRVPAPAADAIHSVPADRQSA
jgi:signal transduction histidine kinase